MSELDNTRNTGDPGNSGNVDDVDGRLRAVCDLAMADVRESAGRHEYDGRIQDLSPEGVRAGVAALGRGHP
ncbi:hypothetical protein C1I98_36840, partial [Spongiactinospora gelatinilytica]